MPPPTGRYYLDATVAASRDESALKIDLADDTADNEKVQAHLQVIQPVFVLGRQAFLRTCPLTLVFSDFSGSFSLSTASTALGFSTAAVAAAAERVLLVIS
ncbi:hypothetical protein PMIN06_003406 [Paraphaeosphaeria minitans]